MMQPPSDILIAGGGIVGLSLAVALRHELGAGIRIEVCDPQAGRRQPSLRASALVAGPRRMLEAIGIWDEIAPDAQPILEMVVTDSRTDDPVRPALLTFGGNLEPGEPFAHMIFNDQLTAALERAAPVLDIPIARTAVAHFETGRGLATVELSDGSRRRTRLLVAADGGRSRLRSLARIRTVGWAYPQAGIVATVAHEREHAGRAYEHFLPSGPFASLPLTERRSSIVWTEKTELAARLAEGDGETFRAALEERFGHRLGAVTLLDRPRAIGLDLGVARVFVAERFALVGDAAHVVHPIAGQGLNLGLRDVADLVERIAETMRLGLDPGAPEPLAAYQRARRLDTVAMAASTDALNRLFSNDVAPLRLLRDLGLGAVDRMPPLKRYFVREAAAVSRAPTLMRAGRR